MGKGGIAAIILEMKKKRGMGGDKPEAEGEPDAEDMKDGDDDEAVEGKDEEASMGEFMDALDSGDKAEALARFKDLLSACYPKE